MPIRLMAMAEIAAAFGVGSSRAHAIVKDPDQHFPDPIAELRVGKIWLADDVEKWITTHRTGQAAR